MKRHESGRFEADEQRFYPTPKGWKPSVTTVNKLVKQLPLGWPAKMTGAGMTETLYLIRDGKITPGQLNDKKIEDLVKKAKSLYLKKSEAGMDLGTRVHKWAEDFYRARLDTAFPPPPPATGDMEKPVHAFLAWDQKEQLQPAFIEKMVWSDGTPNFAYPDKCGYAGSFDQWGTTREGNTLCDIKVSNGHYPNEQVMQLGAYSCALEEREGVVTDAHLILRLDKGTGMPDPRWYSQIDICRGISRFLILVQYWWETFRDLDIGALAGKE
jgi:hypothetical protein